MPYEYAVPTLGHFLRRIAIDYFRYGYVHWVLRSIPLGCDLPAIDQKLVKHYGVTQCRSRRHRQKRRGLAVVQYVRWGTTFVLLATEGKHTAFSRLCSYDVRLVPLHVENYSIGLVGTTVHIRVRRQVWDRVCQRFEALALHKKTRVEARLNSLPFYRFPAVTQQLVELTQTINYRRRIAGLPKVVLSSGTRFQGAGMKRYGSSLRSET